MWAWSGPGGTPPNAITPTLAGASALCLDVNGAFSPDVIDLYVCGTPGSYKNDEWVFNATTGALLTLDTAPLVVGKCITPKGAAA